MITASELAGFFAAHAIWCVSDADGLIPMIAFTDEAGGRKMERLVIDDAAKAVGFGKQKLESNEMDANDAVLIYDGRIPVGDEKSDAIIVELRTYFSPNSEAIIAIPYTKTSDVFRVYKPKLLAWEGCEDFEINQVFEAFFVGVGSHEKGSAVWAECLDESK